MERAGHPPLLPPRSEVRSSRWVTRRAADELHVLFSWFCGTEAVEGIAFTTFSPEVGSSVALALTKC